jgi:hypothetical protein
VHLVFLNVRFVEQETVSVEKAPMLLEVVLWTKLTLKEVGWITWMQK